MYGLELSAFLVILATLQCEKIARMLFFVAFFGRFLGIIQVAWLAMFNI
jgi:hypothetical protein